MALTNDCTFYEFTVGNSTLKGASATVYKWLTDEFSIKILYFAITVTLYNETNEQMIYSEANKDDNMFLYLILSWKHTKHAAIPISSANDS